MRLPALALLAVALVTAGCRKSVAPACRQLCACSPCTDHDLDGCVDKASTSQESAEDKGCTEVFDTFVDCFERHVTCDTSADTLTTSCGRAATNLTTCTDAGSPFATICEDAADRTRACVPNFKPSIMQACNGLLACQSACVLAAPCDVIAGATFDQTFNDCINACSGVVSPPPEP